MLELSNRILITDECVKDFNGKRQHAENRKVIRNGNFKKGNARNHHNRHEE